jgi:hypothetical protein
MSCAAPRPDDARNVQAVAARRTFDRDIPLVVRVWKSGQIGRSNGRDRRADAHTQLDSEIGGVQAEGPTVHKSEANRSVKQLPAVAFPPETNRQTRRQTAAVVAAVAAAGVGS